MKNTEKLLSFEEVKKNKEIIVPRIAEGNPILEKILMHCIDRKIPTIACCIGHKPFDIPYISMQYNKDTRKSINAFLNRIAGMKNVEIMFSTTGFTNNPFNVTVYTHMLNRDEVFSVIEDILSKNIESETLDEAVEAVIHMAINLDFKFEYARVSLINDQFRRKYMIALHEACKGNIYEDASDKVKRRDFNMTYYLYRTSEKLRVATADFESLYPVFSYHNGFVISTSIPTEEKVDRMSELNDILMEEKGTIRRY